MELERVSVHIWSLKTWMLFPVRAWLVVGDDGVTLVDTGFAFMAKAILRAVAQLGAGPLRRILLTHGHGDHAGSVTAILQRQRVPVYAHRTEIPYMEGALPYPRRRRAEASVAQGVVQPLAEHPDGSLLAVAGLKPYLTPGHSPGHVVYHHEEDHVLLAGDLFTSRKGQLRPPTAMFTGNMAEALQSCSIVAQLKPLRLEVCHGGPVLQPAEQLDTFFRRASRYASVPGRLWSRPG